MLHVIQEFGLILFVLPSGFRWVRASLPHCASPDYPQPVCCSDRHHRWSGYRHPAKLFDIPLPVVLGIFSGAVTIRQHWGQGSRSCATWVHQWKGRSDGDELRDGVSIRHLRDLFTMWMLRVIFRVNVETEAQRTSLHAPMAAR